MVKCLQCHSHCNNSDNNWPSLITCPSYLVYMPTWWRNLQLCIYFLHPPIAYYWRRWKHTPVLQRGSWPPAQRWRRHHGWPGPPQPKRQWWRRSFTPASLDRNWTWMRSPVLLIQWVHICGVYEYMMFMIPIFRLPRFTFNTLIASFSTALTP